MSIPSDPWWREFISATPPRTAKLATVRPDGRPHVAPVWVVLDGDDLVLTTGATTAKGTSLRDDPRVSVCFDDERPPFDFVVMEGTATLSEDLDALRQWATTIGGRYMGEAQAEELGRRNGVAGELLVRITPTHVVAGRDVAD